MLFYPHNPSLLIEKHLLIHAKLYKCHNTNSSGGGGSGRRVEAAIIREILQLIEAGIVNRIANFKFKKLPILTKIKYLY